MLSIDRTRRLDRMQGQNPLLYRFLTFSPGKLATRPRLLVGSADPLTGCWMGSCPGPQLTLH